MSMESFAEVFAKKSEDVEKAYKKKQDDARSYGFFSMLSALSAMLCMVLMSGGYATVLTDKIGGILLGLIILLFAVSVVLCIMAFVAKIKAWRLCTDLEDNYIRRDRYGRMPEFYE